MADGSVVIDAKIKDDGMEKGLKAIKNKLKSFRKELDRIASKDMNKLDDAIKRINGRLDNMQELGAAIAIAPAAVPAVAALTGGVLALSSAFGAAGVGAIGFGAVAIPTLKDIFEANTDLIEAEKKLAEADSAEERAEALKELKAATEGLTDSQKEALTAYREFGSFWDEYAKKFQEPVLEMFTTGLETLKNLLELSEPVIHEAAEGLNNVMDALNRSLGTDGVKDFFEYLASDAQSSIENFGTIFGNITLGIMNLMEAFSPLSNDMQDGLVGLTEKFANWTSTLGDSDEFQKFTDYIRENGPLLLELLGNLVDIFIELAEAVAPIGEDILKIATALSGDFAEALENNENLKEFSGEIVILAGAFAALSPILIPIINGLVWLSRLFGGIPALITLGIIAFEFFKVKLEELRDKTLFDIGVWFFKMSAKITEFKEDAKEKIGDFVNEQVDKFQELRDKTVSKITDMVNNGIQKFEDFKKSASEKFNAAKDNIINPIKEAKDDISGFIDEIKGFFDNMKLKIPEITLPRLPKISVGMSHKEFMGASIPVPNITWHKTGGVFTRPVVAGNAGFGDVEEGIIPFAGPHAKKIANLIANEMPNNGNSQSIIVQSILNGRIIAEETVETMSQLLGQRQIGSNRRV
ncbi:hypothetical protein ACFFIX_06655 [Metabacillus herbersteinensis]|uniref:Phage tail tape measure protein n=1 Tax=Metabacillus herbersteinensis TaxID=283816 RepID=A0ABV6GCH7_9BACI